MSTPELWQAKGKEKRVSGMLWEAVVWLTCNLQRHGDWEWVVRGVCSVN